MIDGYVMTTDENESREILYCVQYLIAHHMGATSQRGHLVLIVEIIHTSIDKY